jgi:hypothetical protein
MADHGLGDDAGPKLVMFRDFRLRETVIREMSKTSDVRDKKDKKRDGKRDKERDKK